MSLNLNKIKEEIKTLPVLQQPNRIKEITVCR